MTTKPVETVLAWHAALNEADVERLISLSTVDIEVGGPRGSGHGADLLRDWVNRAAVRLEPRRIFCRAEAEVVVVEQEAHRRPPRAPPHPLPRGSRSGGRRARSSLAVGRWPPGRSAGRRLGLPCQRQPCCQRDSPSGLAIRTRSSQPQDFRRIRPRPVPFLTVAAFAKESGGSHPNAAQSPELTCNQANLRV